MFFTCQASLAGPIRNAIQQHRTERDSQKSQQNSLEEDDANGKVNLPAGVTVQRDIAYGSDKKQAFDVYMPEHAKNAPVIFMVHGGAWRIGDKSNNNVVEKKVAHWVPKGFIFISTNYRMLPDTDPVSQAKDVALAIAFAQDKAESWGADSNAFILMGHSAGAHIVALLVTDLSLSAGIVKKPWLGTVALDSAAYNVEQIMEKPHLPLYDKAFGQDKQYWKKASPFYALTKDTRPVLAVCSSQREDSKTQARQFAEKAKSLGVKVTVLEKDFSHKEINALLGHNKIYTAEVELFLAGLNKKVADLLRK
jgi:acetyl esterase/lipase